MTHHLDHRCERCGCRYGVHRSRDNACPKTTSFGKPQPLPRTDDQIAWFAAEAAHWTAQTFVPR